MSLLPTPRTIWAAASHPQAFFDSLDDAARLGPALVAMVLSALVASLVAGALLLRATSSDAVGPIVLGTPAVILLYLAQVTVLGGLTLMLPAGMDLRAFEVVAWAWVPSGVLAVSLLPVGLFAPLPALLVGALLLMPAWHLWIVWRGVGTFAVARPRFAMILYVLVVFALPAVFLAFITLVLSNVA